MIRRLLTLALLASSVVFATGCGGTGSVSGKVTSKSKKKPIVYGTVTMIGSDSLPHYGTIGKDGSYQVDGVPAGPVKVTVSSPNPKDTGGGGRDGMKVPKPVGGGGGEAAPADDAEIVKGWFPIADKYSDLVETPLRVEVKRGQNNLHDIELD